MPVYTTFAPGRVCLVGEHCDYAKGMSIGLPIAQKVTVYGEPSDSDLITLVSAVEEKSYNLTFPLHKLSTIAPFTDHTLRYSAAAIKTLKDHHYPIRGANLFLSSDLPMRKGLSSSAAVTVATIKFFNTSYSLHLTPDTIAELAYHAEHDILGIGCGRMDQIVSSHNTLVLMNYANAGKPIVTPLSRAPHPMYLLITIPLTDQRDLPSILRAANNAYFRPTQPEHHAFRTTLDKTIPEEVVHPFMTAIRDGDVTQAGKFLRRNQELYDTFFIPVSKEFESPLLYQFLTIAKENGSHGEKWTGAGGAGAFICLTRTVEEQEKLKTALVNQSPVGLRFVTAIL